MIERICPNCHKPIKQLKRKSRAACSCTETNLPSARRQLAQDVYNHVTWRVTHHWGDTIRVEASIYGKTFSRTYDVVSNAKDLDMDQADYIAYEQKLFMQDLVTKIEFGYIVPGRQRLQNQQPSGDSYPLNKKSIQQ